MHRLHPPGDFCLKERINVNDSTDYFGAIGVGRVTHVAVQHRMGILSERRAGSRACDFADSGADGASLVRSSTGSLANPGKLIAGTSCMMCGITAGHTGQIAPTMRIRLHGRRELR
jgi:hypothetical protein